jgi:hypothetical protein
VVVLSNKDCVSELAVFLFFFFFDQNRLGHRRRRRPFILSFFNHMVVLKLIFI